MATQEMRDAPATGPRNEIDIFTTRKREHFDLRPKPQASGQIFL
jgi:hypothetical protein